MFAAIREFLADLGGEAVPKPFQDDDYRVAAAALLYHVSAVDGVVSDEERVKLRRLLAARYGLEPDGIDDLIEAAEAADAEAVDLYGFTSILKRRLDVAERERIVEMMWQLVYADGKVHEFEDNLMWRVAELLGGLLAGAHPSQAGRRGRLPVT